MCYEFLLLFLCMYECRRGDLFLWCWPRRSVSGVAFYALLCPVCVCFLFVSMFSSNVLRVVSHGEVYLFKVEN